MHFFVIVLHRPNGERSANCTFCSAISGATFLRWKRKRPISTSPSWFCLLDYFAVGPSLRTLFHIPPGPRRPLSVVFIGLLAACHEVFQTDSCSSARRLVRWPTVMQYLLGGRPQGGGDGYSIMQLVTRSVTLDGPTCVNAWGTGWCARSWLQEQLSITVCAHVFHTDCLKEVVQHFKTCPVSWWHLDAFGQGQIWHTRKNKHRLRLSKSSSSFSAHCLILIWRFLKCMIPKSISIYQHGFQY